MADEIPEEEIRQKIREVKRRKKRAKIKQHGKGLGKIYRDAISKRGSKGGGAY